MQRLSLGGILGRFVASLLLVLLTWNPSGHSYVNWVAGAFPHLTPLQLFLGLVLLALWAFFAHATWRSLGALGLLLGLGICVALVWLFVNWGWFSLSGHGALQWIVLVIIAALLTVGLCWALFQARVTGQSVVEEVKR